LDELKERLYLLLVVLFGSYAEGNYTVASDVDLLVVYDGEKRKRSMKTYIVDTYAWISYFEGKEAFKFREEIEDKDLLTGGEHFRGKPNVKLLK